MACAADAKFHEDLHVVHAKLDELAGRNVRLDYFVEAVVKHAISRMGT